MASSQDRLPSVIISRRGADRIRAGHVWVYRSDVVSAKDVQPGAVVLVQEQTGADVPRRSDKSVSSTQFKTRHTAAAGYADEPALSGVEESVRATRTLSDKNLRPDGLSDRNVGPTRTQGSAFYSTASEIAIRMISPKPVRDIDQLVRERIRAAIAYRERFLQSTNAYRVVFSEGDFLPGLIVDKYNDIVSLQVLTQAWDSEAMRNVFVSELQDALKPRAIVERVDPRVRRLEQLPERQSGMISTGEEPVTSATRAEFQMNGVRFLYDALVGQKTGAFLDQRENYAAAEKYARGEALDVFCYQGGFALHLARTCERVTGVDSSRPALESAEQNAHLNGREIEWMEANAFDLLRDYSDLGRKYDTIILDPPAFAKSRQNRETALRGYKELNLRALKMLRPGGVLVTCSCSYHVSAADLLDVVASAALDSHRVVRILENRGQAKDHPRILGIPETAYLKCLILLVS